MANTTAGDAIEASSGNANTASAGDAIEQPPGDAIAGVWAHHHGEWRDQSQVVVQWPDAAAVDRRLFEHRVEGHWWETLDSQQLTLIVPREYEHLVMAMTVVAGRPFVSYLPLPHPSGIAIDRDRELVHIASTRNPNQVFDLTPANGVMKRLDAVDDDTDAANRSLMPIRARFFPGCLYMHDLALINGDLYANSVGQNAIVRLGDDGRHTRVWWPKCIETDNGPVFGQNHLQLNSIAAGPSIQQSFFTASADHLSARRPGHQNFPVDRRGVIFDGTTREPLVRGLTRPHSARLHEGDLWVDNSGYGELARVRDGQLETAARLPGWTRGLALNNGVAFVGTSRVIPRFRQYAPGLDVDASQCGIHAIDLASGRILGSLYWPNGNQIFGIDWLPRSMTTGFPFRASVRRGHERERKLFYAFTIPTNESTNDRG